MTDLDTAAPTPPPYGGPLHPPEERQPLDTGERARRASQSPLKPGRKRGANRAVGQQVQARLLNGEELTAAQVEQDYNVGKNFLLWQVRQLEKEALRRLRERGTIRETA